MRIIEFRAWDKLLNRYTNYHSHINFDNPTYIIEEYTGINDIDGVKIFEGDIVDLKNSDINKRGVVGFMRGAFIVNTGKQIWLLGDNFFGLRKVGQVKNNEDNSLVGGQSGTGVVQHPK